MIFRFLGQITVMVGAVLLLIGILTSSFLTGFIQFVVAVIASAPWFEFEAILERQETEMKKMNDEIDELRLLLRASEQKVEQLQEFVGFDVREISCLSCGTIQSNLERCDYCGFLYCEDHWAIHIFEVCETHPNFDPAWEDRVSLL